MGKYVILFHAKGLDEVERVNCGKKAHLLWVGKDSAGSDKGPGSKFLSFHFQNFSGGGPQTPRPPSGLLSWVSPDRPPSLALVWIHAWNAIEYSHIQLGLTRARGKFLIPHFQNCSGGGPPSSKTLEFDFHGCTNPD